MNWFQVLRSARLAASKERLINSRALAKAIELPEKDASAWLGKFVRWGYAIRVDREANGRGRPRTIYRLTKYGLERKAPKKTVAYEPQKMKAVANPKVEEE